MSNQLLPPSDQAPQLAADTSPQEALQIWIDLMKASDKLVMAGLEREFGLESMRPAYRSWYAAQANRHGQHMARLAKRLSELDD